MYQIVSNELYHYGVKGQKWGVRRYQNADGTLTAEGKARYNTDKDMKKEARKEVRTDNKKAYELGRQATIDSNASYIADKKALKAQVRYDKKPTNRRLNNLEAKQRTAERLSAQAKKSKKSAEEHVSELMSKYGNEAVKGLKFDKKGRIKERVNSGKDWVESAAMSAMLTALGTTVLPAIGAGSMMFVATPTSAKQKGVNEYRTTLREEKKVQRSLHS